MDRRSDASRRKTISGRILSLTQKKGRRDPSKNRMEKIKTPDTKRLIIQSHLVFGRWGKLTNWQGKKNNKCFLVFASLCMCVFVCAGVFGFPCLVHVKKRKVKNNNKKKQVVYTFIQYHPKGVTLRQGEGAPRQPTQSTCVLGLSAGSLVDFSPTSRAREYGE